MRTRAITVSSELAGRSVESLLKGELLISDSLIARLKRREAGICLNGSRAYTTARVAEGDYLEAEIGDFPVKRPEPMACPLSIVWEDEDLLVIDKPAGIFVHSSTRCIGELTLENAIAAYLPPEDGLHPVSRLDKGTTGLMIWAKNGYLHELFRRQLNTEGFQKTYLAIAVGEVNKDAGHIHLQIGFEEGSCYKRAVREGGQNAHSEFCVLGRGGGYTLLRLIPHTGRSHQLRLHMAAVGYPLVGDWLYGSESEAITRPALHSSELSFTHPVTGRSIQLRAGLPDDMASVLVALGITRQGQLDL